MDSFADDQVSLLAHFAEFYEELARLKVAMREGRLGVYLMATGRQSVAVSENDLAKLVSERLKALLQQRAKRLASVATQAQSDSYRIAQYLMAALADELLILEVEWPGRAFWEPCLLERALFESNSAGRDFFAQLEELLSSRGTGRLQEDLAAVFLMSLRLGFKGQHRGSHGSRQLRDYNARLIRFMGAASLEHQPAFLQAYQHRIAGTRDERIAPLSRWYRIAALGIVIYLAISTVVWLALTNRLAASGFGSA